MTTARGWPPRRAALSPAHYGAAFRRGQQVTMEALEAGFAAFPASGG